MISLQISGSLVGQSPWKERGLSADLNQPLTTFKVKVRCLAIKGPKLGASLTGATVSLPGGIVGGSCLYGTWRRNEQK